MTIREMEIFIALLKYKTMKKTAEELFISQPTISGVISSIEDKMNTKIFERYGKKLILTPEGEKLHQYTQKILDLHKELSYSIGNNNENIRLRIGATISVGGKLLNSILKQWDKPQPYVNITNTHEIEQKILNAELDCAIVEGAIHSSEIICIPMFRDKMYLFCSPLHEKFTQNSISIENLSGENFILRETGSGTREMTLDLLKNHNIDYTLLWQSNTVDSIFEAVSNNFGITIASERLFSKGSNLKKIDITNCDLSRVFHFIYHKDKYQSKLFEKFYDLCKSCSDY